jgi:hypothetical protein
MSPEWRAYHLFCHGDRNRLLDALVRPAVRSWLEAAWIDRFFFVRYSLGGPHVRLRVRILPGYAAAVEEALERAAAEHFASHPSPASLSAEEVRRGNRRLGTLDPGESEDDVYPDNSLRRMPLRFETERYGGEGLLPASLDFFTLSSARALRFVADHGASPWAAQLPQVFRSQARLAWGFARDGGGMIALLEAAATVWGEALAPAAARGDAVFAQSREVLRRLLREELAGLPTAPAGSAPWLEAEAALRLARGLRSAEAGVRDRIVSSHLHMAANRCGLDNPNEVYLSRLLGLAARDLAASDPAFWDRLEATFGMRGDNRGDGDLAALLPPAFAAVFAPPAAAPQEISHA